jgi:hypothetical protein
VAAANAGRQLREPGREPIDIRAKMRRIHPRGIWETEGPNAQGLNARMAPVKAGRIKPPAIDVATAQSSWWVAISPFIDKDDLLR